MTGEADRRETKRFEPPPWERERFDALRERQAQEKEAPAPETPSVTAGGVSGSQEAPGEAVGEDPRAATGQADASTVFAKPGAGPGAELEKGMESVSDAQVDTMLVLLSGEEPRVDKHVKTAGLFSAGVLLLVGIGLLVAGVVLLSAAHGAAAASLTATTTSAMGLTFAGVGVWLGLRVMRGQGD